MIEFFRSLTVLLFAISIGNGLRDRSRTQQKNLNELIDGGETVVVVDSYSLLL